MKMFFLITLLFAGNCVFAQPAFAKAEQLFQNKKYQRALANYHKLQEAHPQDTTIVERIGDCHAYLNEFENAAGWYEKLVESNEKSANYNFKLGAALAMQAKNASKFKALTLLGSIKHHLKTAADLDPEHIEVRYALVQLYCELPGILGGSYKTSKKYADQLSKISEIDGWYAHAIINEHRKDLKAAENCLKKALEIGNSITAFTKLGKLQEEKVKDLESAYRTYLKAAQRFPTHQPFQSAVERIEIDLVTQKSRS
ncbi:hypothetical protein BST97_14125 [Nonlabens spongiae]|uniref:Uncharacterized protein n=1 Tax=Nonlabens spongiae TaxID=331648 RepID=A0A1W6MN48_9FLAO|nr:hypothetical protein [Nonlabens spongiae]ARN79034.1 hypothetical protein BST97_14125 [Nonlabens spongiae]